MRTYTRSMIFALAALVLMPARVLGDAPERRNDLNRDSARLRARLEAIDSARRDSPQVFNSIEPYYQSDPIPQGTPHPPIPTAHRGGIPKRMSLELLDPEWVVLTAKYPDAYSDLDRLADEVRRTYTGPGALRERVTNLWKRSELPEEEFNQLCAIANVTGVAQQKYNRKYLLAWEEGLLTTTPIHVKAFFAQIVISIDAPESRPVLGEALRLTIREWDGFKSSQRDPDQIALGGLADVLAAGLAQSASEPNLIELSDVIRLTDEPKRAAAATLVGRFLAHGTVREQAWDALLQKLADDPTYREHVMRLREAKEEFDRRK